MKLIKDLLRKHLGLFVFAMIGSIISGLSTTAIIHIVNDNINKGFEAAEYGIGMFFGTIVIVFIAGVSARFLLNNLGNRIIYELQMIMAARILSTPYSHLEKLGGARVYATFTEDIASISGTFSLLPTVVFSLSLISGGLCYLAYLSWIYLAVLIGFIVVGLSASSFLMGRSAVHMKDAREGFDDLFGNLNAVVHGNKELKLNSHRMVMFLKKILNISAARVRDNNVKASNNMALFDEWGNLLVYIIIGVVFFVASQIWPSDNYVLTGYILAILFLAGPIGNLLESVPILMQGQVAFEKIGRLNLAEIYDWNAIEPPERNPNDNEWKSLQLQNIDYTYVSDDDDYKFHLGPINIDVTPGNLVFIIGGNGSGKTTLAKVLTGLYKTDSGKILLNGELITDSNEEWYRNHFSSIFSDFFVFHELIGPNGSECENSEIAKYLKKLHLSHKVTIENNKLSTIDLSHGQRKRLALLSAYLEDKPIYVFDEWAADQDPIFKEIFYHQIIVDLKKRGKGVIVISHDDRYFHLADEILILEEGKLVKKDANLSAKNNVGEYYENNAQPVC